MGKELEVKFGCTNIPEAMEALEAAYSGQWETVVMASTYFDTSRHDLANRRWTLRLREENGIQIITCKTPGETGARNEWEAPAADLTEGIRLLLDMGAPANLTGLYQQGLKPVCGARFTRKRRPITEGFGEAELALDEGILTGGNRELFFREIEVELKGGDEGAFLSWCQAFRKRYDLTPEKKSKYARAAALREG